MIRKRFVHLESSPVVYREDLAAAGIPADFEHGASMFRGVFIVWDADQDERLLRVVDRMLKYDVGCLVAAYESKGCLRLIWREQIPEEFAEGKSVVAPDPRGNDTWGIWESYLLPVEPQP